MRLRLRQRREELGLSLRDLAKRCGREASGIGKVERGLITLTLPTLLILAQALECHPWSLVLFDDEDIPQIRGVSQRNERSER